MKRLGSPRLARALVALLLPREERQFVLGDLEETFGADLDRSGGALARRRYWRDALSAIRSMTEERLDKRAAARAERRQGDGLVRNLLRDARYGLRLLLRRPGFTAVAIVTLALGIGANTAIFSVMHAVLLKPLPYSDPDRLVIVTENNLSRGWTSFTASPANFFDWTTQSTSFAALAAWGSRPMNYTGGESPERLRTLSGTAGFLEMLDGTPAIGRGFLPDEFDMGKHRVALLGHGFWQRAYGGNPNILEQTIQLNGEPYTIVGVMNAGWRFGGRNVDVFTPFAFPPDNKTARGAHYLSVVGRLKPGVTIESAQTEMTGIANRLAEAYPATNKGWGVVVTSLHTAAVGNVQPMLIVLLGAVGVVLLVACANLANMHLARATVRAREIAVRTAIGAGRGRIVRQLLTESLVLALCGGVLGLLLAFWGTSAFLSAYPNLVPRSADIGVSLTVLAFSAALSIVTAIVFGLVPAIAAARTNLNETLKTTGRGGGGAGRRWLRGALVVSEMTLAVVLLTAAGLLIKSFLRLADVHPGFETSDRIAATTILPTAKYTDAARIAQFYDRALERVKTIPGVESVALASTVPISGSDEIYSIEFEGRPPLPPGQGVSAIYYLVSPEYFSTMGIPLLKGRTFTEQDRDGTTRVAVINERFARLHYPNEEPIGQRIRMGRNSNIVREIIGVVGNVKHYGLADKDQAQMYEPFRQMPDDAMTFVLKTSIDPANIANSIRREIQAVDPDQPVVGVSPLKKLVADSSALARVQTLLVGAFATIALILACVGLYGVMAYAVSQRTQEIGVRMALGADRGSVMTMVLGQAGMLIGLGLVMGVGGALLLGRLLSTQLEPMLFQVTPSDVTILATVALILAVVGLLASIIPARRATRVDPIQALRTS